MGCGTSQSCSASDSSPDRYRPRGPNPVSIRERELSRMTIVSQTVARTYSFGLGVYTRAKSQVAPSSSTLANTPKPSISPTTSTGIKRAISWVGRVAGGDANTHWVIEGTASYEAVLTVAVTDAGYKGHRCPGGYAKAGRGVCKTDPQDAQRMAATALTLKTGTLRIPRLYDGARVPRIL